LAELEQALLLPEEECAAADAHLAQGFAEGLAEPQVADSGLPPAYSVVLQVAGSELLLAG
jgi:hypothetical protein